MPVTVIYDDTPFAAASATSAGDDLWLSPEDLRRATGWEHRPQGLCRGDLCVPIPPARTAAFIADDARLNLAEFARYVETPVVHDDGANVWCFGTPATTRRDALRSVQAPDFHLPDLDGVVHSLSDFRAKKVLLLSWASW